MPQTVTLTASSAHTYKGTLKFKNVHHDPVPDKFRFNRPAAEVGKATIPPPYPGTIDPPLSPG